MALERVEDVFRNRFPEAREDLRLAFRQAEWALAPQRQLQRTNLGDRNIIPAQDDHIAGLCRAPKMFGQSFASPMLIRIIEASEVARTMGSSAPQ